MKEVHRKIFLQQTKDNSEITTGELLNRIPIFKLHNAILQKKLSKIKQQVQITAHCP